MKIPSPLISGTLKARRKRFLADIHLKSGEEVIAHCPNPGSMKGNANKGTKVLLMDRGKDYQKDGYKLRYRWIYTNVQKHPVCIDTSLANSIVEEALQAKQISNLAHYDKIEREFTVGESRLDFLLTSSKENIPACFMEIKSVSMMEDSFAQFPDSVTTRGQKHLLSLMELRQQDYRTVIFYLIQREGLKYMKPAKHIDPVYASLLKEAKLQGVEVLAYDIQIKKGFMGLGKEIEVQLD